MRVIICGAGRVGFGIARRLSREKNDVTIIDQSKKLIRTVVERLDVRGIAGNGAWPDTLEAAGAREADMVIAVTHSDEINMVSCQIAHALFDVPTKIARVRSKNYLDPRYSDLFSRKNLPVDVVISPEQEVSESILQRLVTPGAFDVKEFAGGKIWAAGIRLGESCAILNTPLRQIAELFPDLGLTIAMVRRGDRMWCAHEDDHLQTGDRVYVICDRKDLARAIGIMGETASRARRVIIIGGGNIGLHIAANLEKTASVKIRLIEKNRERAEHIAETLERTVVLRGDGLDREILSEAGIAQAESVVSVTDSDQVNILTSVVAKRNGARRSMALINNQDYIPVAEAVGIDRLVDPRATTVSTILQHIRRGRIKGIYSVSDGAAEVVDAIALETSPLVNRPLRDAELTGGIVIGAICRKGEVIIPSPDTVIRQDDRVVLMAMRENIEDVEKLFRVSIDYF